ncbi:hypothetical protein [Pseudaeromonas paramecii]|uniref:Molecular chaperone n=1 Tax=Pseudaeromonas paramecii TaxID=2138166 RepID=A0ABP8QC21_9GAMM
MSPIPVYRACLVSQGDSLRLLQGDEERLQLSWSSIAAWLKDEPASEGQLELAIAFIEDELMPRLPPAAGGLLALPPDLWQALLAVSPVTTVPLSTEAVEGLFHRLAALAWGQPASQLGLPADRQFASRLLLIRELLHHGGFDGLVPANGRAEILPVAG